MSYVFNGNDASTFLIIDIMDHDGQRELLPLMMITNIMELTIHPPRTPIVLDLSRWTSPASREGHSKDTTEVEKVLQYFDEIAKANDLQDTPAAKKIIDALAIIRDNSPTDLTKLLLYDRLAFESTIQMIRYPDISNEIVPSEQPKSIESITESIYKQLIQTIHIDVPIFNIWDSISLIYTLYVEPVESSLYAELHLFQFRSIIQILSRHWYTGPPFMSPSTIVATWSEPQSNRSRPVTIVFGTTCVGKLNDKIAMMDARYQFAQNLIKGLDIVRLTSSHLLSIYKPGNCPEWFTIIIICRRRGNYFSLCQNNSKDLIYKLCQYCKELTEVLEKMEVNIYDLWDRSFLGEGEVIEPLHQFSSRALMSYSVISEKFKHIKGVIR